MKDIYRQFGIYGITNTENGKTYVGKTGASFGDRWDCHRAQLNGGYHDNPHLQKAWDKYGSECFKFSIIEAVDNIQLLNELEIKYISKYRALNLCYNISDGGDGGSLLGKHLSDSAKRKIGEKNRLHMLGRSASDETRKKMSQSQSARYGKWSKEDREQWGEMMSRCASGYKWSKESRENFSKIQRARPNGAKFTPDEILKIRKERECGATLKELADKYSTSPSYISSIAHKRRWADI